MEDFFISTYKHLHTNWETSEPAVLVLDNAPYHCFGMVNPKTQPKSDNASIMRSMNLREWTDERRSVRDGGYKHFVVPEQGDFERAPRGPSAAEAAEAAYRAMVARGDGRLKT